MLKRVFDIFFSFIGLIILLIPFIIISIVIIIDSRGGIFYKQKRVGKNGIDFYLLKFRSMHVDAEKSGLLTVGGRDSRITRAGYFIRKYKIDELPQLFNVLSGEMSLVGPRPFFVKDMLQYEDHHFERLSVLPGITGLWQVSGRSDVIDFDEVVRLDSEYIRNWTLVRDLVILVRTLPAALGRGAY